MDYDFLITDIESWGHPRFAYRVVYHLGYDFYSSSLLSAIGKMPTSVVVSLTELQERNKAKLTGYIEQLLDDYVIEQSNSHLHVYCNEWIDETVLRLACTADKYFLRPACIEHLGSCHGYM